MAIVYIVEQSNSASGPWVAVPDSPLATTHDTISNLSPGTYYFRITAHDLQLNIFSIPTITGPYTITAAGTESAEGTRITAIGQAINASKTPGVPAPTGPFNTFALTTQGFAPYGVLRNGVFDTGSGNVDALIYHNHTTFEERPGETNIYGGPPAYYADNGTTWIATPNPFPAAPPPPPSASELATATFTSLAVAGGFQYTITLNNIGPVAIHTFWFAWDDQPDTNFMTAVPTSVTSPPAFTSLITHLPGVDGYGIQWVSNTTGLPPNSNTTFGFTSTMTPSQMTGPSTFEPAFVVTSSFVYAGVPLSGPGYNLVVQNAGALPPPPPPPPVLPPPPPPPGVPPPPPPPPVLPPPPPPPPPPIVPPPAPPPPVGFPTAFPGSGSFTDQFNNVWSVNAGGHPVVNSFVDNASNAKFIELANGVIWQQDVVNDWYNFTPTGNMGASPQDQWNGPTTAPVAGPPPAPPPPAPPPVAPPPIPPPGVPPPAPPPPTTPSKIVVVIEENHGYGDIIGNGQAAYINSLANGGALLTNYFAISHPSEPNYLALYAGSDFGVGDDYFHAEPDPSLFTALQAAGKAFTGYAESGSPEKHNPWEAFPEGTSVEKAFSQFPTTAAGFAALPDVSFVIPNLNNDMHDGTIQQADSWLQSHIDAYAQWAKTNNSLLIITWDEDDSSGNNQVAYDYLRKRHTRPLRHGI
jgi:hypothetical protein